MLKILKAFKYAYRGVDVVEYKPGDDDLPDGDACEKVALDNEWVKRVKGKLARVADTGAPASEKPKTAIGLFNAIAAVIPDLDKVEDATAAGAPSCPALERELGYPVTAAERDAAWEAWVKANPPESDPAKTGELGV